MTEVAVVILNYNGRKFLEQFLPGVITHSKVATIYVADNGSTDDSITFLETNFKGIQLIRIPQNMGFCGGYNFALKQIQAPYFVLLNSDIEVTAGWIEPVIELFKKDNSIAAAQPKILSFKQQTHFEYAGAAGGFIDRLGYPFCRGRIFNHLEKDTEQYNDNIEVFWATGACMFIRSDVYNQMEGLDDDFFAHMEEIDLCWRIKRAGYKIYYCGASKVYHVGGGTLSASNPRKTFLNFKNGLSLIFKHLPPITLWWKLPCRIFLDWCAALLFLFRGAKPDSMAVLKAHQQFFKGILNDYQKRTALKKTLKTFKVSKIYSGILPIKHFITGIKKYTDL